MTRDYRNLLITDEIQTAYKAKEEGKYVVLSLPADGDYSYEDFPFVLMDANEVTTDYLDKLILRFEDKPWHILETRRCKVREMCEEDVDRLYQIYAHPEVTAFMEPLYEDPDQERAYVTDYKKCHYRFYEFGMWVIEEKESGQIIGRAGFDMTDYSENPQLGFMLTQTLWRQGYMKEVLTALLEYAQKELLFTVVEARSHIQNIASIELLKGLGFNRIGEKDYHYIFSKNLNELETESR